MHHKLIFNSKKLNVSFKSLCLLNFLYCKQANGNALPQLKKTAMADFMGIYRGALSTEIDELSEAKVLESSGVLVGENKLRKSTVITPNELTCLPAKHVKLITPLLEGMYTDREIKGRSKRLNAKNSLLVCLMLSFADKDGEITALSQASMKRFLNISEAQLKSQLQKLKALSILETVIPGGSYNAVVGRVKSKLRLDFKVIENLTKTERDSERDSIYLRRVAKEAKLDIIALRPLEHMNELVHPTSARAKLVTKKNILKPLVIAEGFEKALGQANPVSKHRFYSHLSTLCISYAELVMKQIPKKISSITYSPLDVMAEAAKSDPTIKGVAIQIYKRMLKDLDLKSLPEFYCSDTKDGVQPENFHALIAGQKRLIFQTVVTATMLIVSEIYEQLAIKQDTPNLEGIRLKQHKKMNEVLVFR